MPLSKFISHIDSLLEGLVPGIKLYGLAQTVQRTTGNELEQFPVVVRADGEMTYAGFDDIHPVSIYHKQGRIATTTGRIGTGDSTGPIINAYQMSMIIYLDRSRVNIMPDELVLYLQANMPDMIRVPDYKSVLTRLNSVILNTEQIFNQEYKGIRFSLPANKSLIQIDYTIESAFLKNCFEKCPEVLTC